MTECGCSTVQASTSGSQPEDAGSNPSQPHQIFLREIITKEQRDTANDIIRTYHSYKKKTRTVGRQLNWLIEEDDGIVGTMGLSSCGVFLPQCVYQFIGVKAVGGHSLRTLYLQRIATNWRCTLIPEASKNVGSQALSLMVRICNKRWKEKYGEGIVLLLSWIELPRKGSMYLAAGWKRLGLVKNVVNEDGTSVINPSGKTTKDTSEGITLSQMPFGAKKFSAVQNKTTISSWTTKGKVKSGVKGTLKYRWVFAKPLTADWKEQLIIKPP